MGKRFAIVIGVAAAGVMALGAQTGWRRRRRPGRVKYDTKLTITHEETTVTLTSKGTALWHGGVGSEVRKCVERATSDPVQAAARGGSQARQ